MKLDVMLKQFKIDVPILLLSEIYCNEGNNCCFTECLKKIYVGMLSDV